MTARKPYLVGCVYLHDFCAPPDHPREVLHHPFRVGDYEYASDARIIVRVPARANTRHSHDTPLEAASIIARAHHDARYWVPLDAPVKTRTGVAEYHHDDDPGRGIVLDTRYVDLMRDAGCMQIGYTTELAPVAWSGECSAVGAVMPMRR